MHENELAEKRRMAKETEEAEEEERRGGGYGEALSIAVLLVAVVHFITNFLVSSFHRQRNRDISATVVFGYDSDSQQRGRDCGRRSLRLRASRAAPSGAADARFRFRVAPLRPHGSRAAAAAEPHRRRIPCRDSRRSRPHRRLQRTLSLRTGGGKTPEERR